ncbi:hypothetical protein BZA05DRAFT_457296 [Tricharina praecox]|uniref:uncharacterized protein n=1 Tax=Tricharina praecox TaxID=43433 RepID=UPI00221F2C69|nr:uncharacterized protein BZA05DRAFT_457296 [Tricharina praecox]KAI5848097.1 hypothetical protein BZA05DRAFT_457296 [Tricharina praecox]
MSPQKHNYNLRKRAAKAAAATPQGRKARKTSKATGNGISKTARTAPKTIYYTVKTSTMARLAEMEFAVNTTLVEGVRFYRLPDGSKRAPRGVVVMKISIPAGVEGGEWPDEIDFEEIRGEEEVERQAEAEAEENVSSEAQLQPPQARRKGRYYHAPKTSKATGNGISKTARTALKLTNIYYAAKPSTMARLAEMEFSVHTTLVEVVRFYRLPGGSKRAPNGVMVLKISISADVEGGEWPEEMDLLEEEVEVCQEAEHEKKLEQQLPEQRLEKEQQEEEEAEKAEEAEEKQEEGQAGNTSRLSCINM